MTWKHTDPEGHETSKTRWRAVPYTRGKGLDLGCGADKLFATNHVIGVDSGKDTQLFKHVVRPDVWHDVSNLRLWASGSMDFVYSSHVLEHFPYEQVPEVLREWTRVLNKGGYLVLYLPAHGLYPDPGEPHVNPDHKWAVTYELVVAAMEKVARDWDLVKYELCDKDREYSHFFAFKML